MAKGWDMNKKVLVTGLLGQDGATMCEYLLGKDSPNLGPLKVFGMTRRLSNPSYTNCESILDHPDFQIVYGDLSDEVSINNLVKDIQPDYFINFAANSFVACSWSMPLQVFDVNALGVMRCLEAIRNHKPDCRFYSAGSSEQFGDVNYSPQDLEHPFKPRSPYGASKCAAHHIVKVYRDSYDMYAVQGLLFNHEGTKRGEEFVTRKITKGVARIYDRCRSADNWRTRHGGPAIFNPIELGNVDAKRDWSDSEDFIRGVWMMLNQDDPKDYLLASGETHSIREFVEKAFAVVDMEGRWEGEGLDEKYIYNGGEHTYVLVRINPDFYRPAEVDLLHGDPSLAEKDLGWKPEISFDNLVEKMVQWDIGIVKHEPNRRNDEDRSL
jgi:GDPmannose 4,6-dehydratase